MLRRAPCDGDTTSMHSTTVRHEGPKCRAASKLDPRDPKVECFAHFRCLKHKISKTQKKTQRDPKNWCRRPEFKNRESIHSSRFLVLRIRYSKYSSSEMRNLFLHARAEASRERNETRDPGISVFVLPSSPQTTWHYTSTWLQC